MFSFTKDGKLQSLDLMYSFFLSVGVFFVQFLISNGITMLVERLFPAWSRGAKNAADILLPVLLSMLLALILFRLIRKKSIVTVAYVIAFLLVGILILYMACTYDAETGSVMIAPFLGIFLAPTAGGAALAIWLFVRWRKAHPDPILEEEAELQREEEAEQSQKEE